MQYSGAGQQGPRKDTALHVGYIHLALKSQNL